MRICASLATLLAGLFAFQFAPIAAQVNRPPIELSDESKAACVSAGKVEIPTADLPSSSDRARLSGCNPLLLYYGDPNDTKGLTPNYADARKCAYLARENNFEWARYFKTVNAPKDDPGITNEPLETLSLLYANGDGVPPNLDLALRFACGKNKDEWGLDDQIQSLIWLKSNEGSYIGICGEASGAFNPCLGLENIPNWQDYNRQLEAFTAHWSQRKRQALDRLREIDTTFVHLDEPKFDNGRDWGQDGYDLDMKVYLLQRLQQAQKHPPHFSADDLRKADAKLNSAFRQALAASDKYFDFVHFDPDQPNSDRIRKAQRAWLNEREAWVAFGSVVWPAVSADSWRTWLTLQRAGELKSLKTYLTLPSN